MSGKTIRLLKKEFKLPIEVCEICEGESEIDIFSGHDMQELCRECGGKGYKTHIPTDKTPARPKMKRTCLKCGYYDKSLGICFVRNSCPKWKKVLAYDEWRASRALRSNRISAKLRQKRDKSL